LCQLGRAGDGHGKAEGAADPRLAFDHKLAAVERHQVAGDRDPQPGARLAAHQAVIGAEEFLLQAGQLLGRHADAGIADADQQMVRRDLALFAAIHSNADGAAVGGVFVGVAHQIGEDLHQPFPVAEHRWQVVRHLHLQPVVPRLDLGPGVGHRFLDHLPQLDGRQLQFDASRLQA